METPILFEEQQGLRQSWLRYLLPLLVIIAVTICIVQAYTREESLRDIVIAITILFIATIFIFSIRLETQIKTDGIYVRFSPFHPKPRHYSWDMIDIVYIRKYNSLREYGGWGIRTDLLMRKNWAFNISGSTGIQLVLKDGSLLLIGTQKPLEAAAALKKLGKLHHVE